MSVHVKNGITLLLPKKQITSSVVAGMLIMKDRKFKIFEFDPDNAPSEIDELVAHPGEPILIKGDTVSSGSTPICLYLDSIFPMPAFIERPLTHDHNWHYSLCETLLKRFIKIFDESTKPVEDQLEDFVEYCAKHLEGFMKHCGTTLQGRALLFAYLMGVCDILDQLGFDYSRFTVERHFNVMVVFRQIRQSEEYLRMANIMEDCRNTIPFWEDEDYLLSRRRENERLAEERRLAEEKRKEQELQGSPSGK